MQAEEYVPLPKGDVHKKKEIVQVRLLERAHRLACVKRATTLTAARVRRT